MERLKLTPKKSLWTLHTDHPSRLPMLNIQRTIYAKPSRQTNVAKGEGEGGEVKMKLANIPNTSVYGCSGSDSGNNEKRGIPLKALRWFFVFFKNV